MLTKTQFKAAYITQFLAAYMASRYDEDCQTGHPNKPYDNQPVNDAAFLADCAWEQIVAHADCVQSDEFCSLFCFEEPQ